MKKKNDDGRKKQGRAAVDRVNRAPKNARIQRRDRPISSRAPVQEARKHAQGLIRKLLPLACTLTINFAHAYPDHLLLEWMNELLRQLNKSLFRNGFKKKKRGCHLSGICSIEVCRDGGRLDNCLHFHFLIQPTRTLTASNCLQKLLPKVLKEVENIKDDLGRSISNAQSVKVSPYWGPGTLAKYYTKEFEERGIDAYDFRGGSANTGTPISGKGLL